jgi:hypothetical protein
MGARRKGREIVRQTAGSIVTGAVRGLVGRKFSPEKLQQICNAARKMPVELAISQATGVSSGMLRYMQRASEKGQPGDGLDMTLPSGDTVRFHIALQEAMEAGFDDIDIRSIQLARGELREILHFQGRVQYKFDPQLVAMGFTGEEALLRDEKGELVPETVPILDSEHMRWVLKQRKPKEYGQTMKVEHDHRVGGVVMVTPALSPKQVEQKFGGNSDIVDVDFEIPKDEGEK